MYQFNPEAIASALEEMRAARDELAAGCTFMTTKQVVDLCPVPLSAETLLTYPHWVIPRVAKNPRAKRPQYLFDPRDVRDLPRVLAAWQAAVAGGREDEFAQGRTEYLARRDFVAKEAA